MRGCVIETYWFEVPLGLTTHGVFILRTVDLIV